MRGLQLSVLVLALLAVAMLQIGCSSGTVTSANSLSAGSASAAGEPSSASASASGSASASASSPAASDNERRVVRATLTGYQEVPAISTTGHGEFVARLDDTSLEFELRYADMEDAVNFAHVHIGQRGVNGGVIFFLCGGGGRPACTSPSGTFTGTVIASDIIGPAGQGIAAGQFAEVLRALRSGNTYANVHSVAPPNGRFPGGEIRGQIRTDSEHNPD